MNHHTLCESGKHGDTPPFAAFLHHIIRVEDNPDLLTDEENCVALCAACHAVETGRELREARERKHAHGV
jgi:5-methylcytosine-specific restriction endonuclease McrA